MDDLKAYEYIDAIVRQGSYSKAAKKLFISQPSLSQYIIRLEEELDCEIFLRKTLPIRLTEFGKILYEKLATINLIKKSIKTSVEDIKNLNAGAITVGCLNYHCICIMASLLPIFKEKYPNIEINILEGTLLELERYAVEGKTDFSILIEPLSSPNLNTEILTKEDILIVANEKNRLSKMHPCSADSDSCATVNISDLEDEEFIILQQGKKLRKTFQEISALMKKPPKIILETNDVINSIVLASCGMGIALATDMLLKIRTASMPIRYFKLSAPLKERIVVAAYNSSYDLSKASRMFLDVLKEYLLSTK